MTKADSPQIAGYLNLTLHIWQANSQHMADYLGLALTHMADWLSLAKADSPQIVGCLNLTLHICEADKFFI
jgi:hypothetical protein